MAHVKFDLIQRASDGDVAHEPLRASVATAIAGERREYWTRFNGSKRYLCGEMRFVATSDFDFAMVSVHLLSRLNDASSTCR